MFPLEIYPPLQEKITLPISKMRDVVIDTAGQGRLALKNGYLTKQVSTCNQYQKALNDGYHMKNDYDVSLLSFYTLWCGSLTWLEKAKAAKVSFVQGVSLPSSFGQLPSKLFFSGLGSLKEGDTLIEKYPDLTLIDVKKYSISIESKRSKLSAVISLLAKGDFKSDGKQALLLSVAEYSSNGNYHQYGVFSVTKRSKKGRFVLVS